jgi:competence protein ComEC
MKSQFFNRNLLIWGVISATFPSFGWYIGSRKSPDRVVFLSVGQGDCAVVQSDGRAILIDTGPATGESDAAQRIVLPKLRQLGIDTVDLILLSHPDLDHVGGVPTLLKAFPNVRVVMSAQYRMDPEMRRRLEAWHLDAARIDWLDSESRGQFGLLTWRISCPYLPAGADENDGSMFIRVGRGKEMVDFSGDAPQRVENQEAPIGDWSAMVMKAGHHGSRTASSPFWLGRVHPAWVVISCGKENRYGHPHREALERILGAKAQIARTDQEGDIEFDWQENGLRRVLGP